MKDMNLNRLNIARVLINELQHIPIVDDAVEKHTIRLSKSQEAFINSVQKAMGTKVSLTQAVSTVIDLVMHYSIHPCSERVLGDASLLGLFSRHGIAAIHINTILKLMKLPPAPTAILNSPEAFSSHIGVEGRQKLGELFGVNSEYLDGTAIYPYCIGTVGDNAVAIKLLALMETKQSIPEELQPQVQLQAYTCPEESGFDLSAYFKVECAIDRYARFSVYRPVGRYVGENGEACFETFSSNCQEKGIRIFKISARPSEMRCMREGGFAVN